jgi:hypothetical protein
MFVRQRDGLGGSLLAMAVWTKFFPIVILPLVLVDRLRGRRWRDAGLLALSFVLVSALMNAPLLLTNRPAWLYFFQTNRARPRELNFWNFFDRWQLTTEQINSGSAFLLAVGMLAIVLLQWRVRSPVWLPAACGILAWFFFVNKVYSPQYSLWIVVLLAIIGAAPPLAVAWSAADLIYFWSSFVILGQLQFGDAAGWFFRYALFPAMALREGLLLLIVGWCAGEMWRRRAGQP